MLKETSNTNQKNRYEENLNLSKDKMVCKDGFCTLPNQTKISKEHKNDMNLFDPI